MKLEADSGCKHFQNALYSMMIAGRTHTHRVWQKKQWTVDTDPNLGLDPLLPLAQGLRYTATVEMHAWIQMVPPMDMKPTNGTYYQTSDSEQI